MFHYILIGTMLYLSDILGVYFPIEKRRKRLISKKDKDMNTKRELKDIIVSTLCNYLDNDLFITEINPNYFKDKNDIININLYNKNIDKIKNKINKLHNDMINQRNKLKNKNLDDVKVNDMNEIKDFVIKKFNFNNVIQLNDDYTLGDIYKLFISYDFYTHNDRIGYIDLDFKTFVKRYLPNKYKNILDEDEIKITKIDVIELIEFIIKIEYVEDMISKEEIALNNIILIVSLWTFCMYFKELIVTFNGIGSKEKKCLLNISNTRFDVFFNKNKTGSKNKDCNLNKIRDLICDSIINDFVNHIFENKKFALRLIDFFELGSVDNTESTSLGMIL